MSHTDVSQIFSIDVDAYDVGCKFLNFVLEQLDQNNRHYLECAQTIVREELEGDKHSFKFVFSIQCGTLFSLKQGQNSFRPQVIM